jgi:hypothetical protein
MSGEVSEWQIAFPKSVGSYLGSLQQAMLAEQARMQSHITQLEQENARLKQEWDDVASSLFGK